MSDRDYYTLREVKRHDCLGLLRQPMMQVGASTQTLAAVRRLASKGGETFASVRVIADLACLQPRTVQRHLDELVAYEWLEYRSRQRRRTPTYIVPKSLLNAKDEMKFGILPRWAAASLPTWAEKSVFALVNSRDSLNEKISDETEIEDVDMQGRLQYSVRLLAKDSGLSERSVARAKARLVNRGFLTIDQLITYRDELGRIHSTADTLMLNPDFKVCSSLVDRTDKMSHCNPLDTLNRTDKMSSTPRKNVVCTPDKMSFDPLTKCRLQLSQPLSQSSEAKKKTTAEPTASAAVCFASQEKAQGEKVYEKDQLVGICCKVFPTYPKRISEAIDLAVANGCTLFQVAQRIRWAYDNRDKWPFQHQAGAIFIGISEATPELTANLGWPS